MTIRQRHPTRLRRPTPKRTSRHASRRRNLQQVTTEGHPGGRLAVSPPADTDRKAVEVSAKPEVPYFAVRSVCHRIRILSASAVTRPLRSRGSDPWCRTAHSPPSGLGTNNRTTGQTGYDSTPHRTSIDHPPDAIRHTSYNRSLSTIHRSGRHSACPIFARPKPVNGASAPFVCLSFCACSFPVACTPTPHKPYEYRHLLQRPQVPSRCHIPRARLKPFCTRKKPNRPKPP